MASELKPKEPTPTNAAERPTMRSVSPDYAEALDTEAKLNADIAAAEAEIQRLIRTESVIDLGGGIKLAQFGNINDGRVVYPSPPKVPEPEEHDSRIMSLLGRLTPPKVKREAPAPHFDTERKRVAELGEQVDFARQAHALLQPKLHQLRLEASVLLCRELESHYRPMAARLCAAQAELANAIIEHDGFLSDLRRQGAALSHLRPCLTRGPNEVSEPVESISSVLAWAAGHGWFDGQIPARSK